MGIPVIIDTDIGSDIDDTWALVMALGCPELDVRLVVTCTGDVVYRARIVAKLLTAAGRTDVPVGLGIAGEMGPQAQAAWVEGYHLADYAGDVREDGVEAMARLIMESPEPVVLVCIGPLPNIASLLQRYPAVVQNARFVGMHGAIYKGYVGRSEVDAEYNVVRHLAAAKVVFASALPKAITPLDSCGTIRLGGDRYARLMAGRSPSLSALFENYRCWLTAINKDPAIADVKSSTLFDTVAIYLAFADELLHMEDLKILVTDDGKTVVADAGSTVAVAVGWNQEAAFLDLLVDRLLAAP